MCITFESCICECEHCIALTWCAVVRLRKIPLIKRRMLLWLLSMMLKSRIACINVTVHFDDRKIKYAGWGSKQNNFDPEESLVV